MPLSNTSVDRRDFLRASSCTILSAIAGCSSVIDGEIKATLVVNNATDSEYSVWLSAKEQRSGEILVDESFELSAGNERQFQLSADDKIILSIELGTGASRTSYWGGSCSNAKLDFVINGPQKIAYMAPACD